MVEPLFARVLLHREKRAKIGNILVPENSAKRLASLKAKVIAKGPTADETIEIGNEVLIGRYSGDWINEHGEPGEPDVAEYFIVQDEDISAVVK